MARIFIAIRFNNSFKDALVSIQDALKRRGVQGDYCPYGNLHMTLAFVGDIPIMDNGNKDNNVGNVIGYGIEKIRKAVSEVYFEPFCISLGELGHFPTKFGVIWCGTKDTDPIATIAARLRTRLEANGVQYSKTTFIPHISLVQHPSAIVTDIAVPQTTMSIERICIMRSDRIDGKLVYSEI